MHFTPALSAWTCPDPGARMAGRWSWSDWRDWSWRQPWWEARWEGHWQQPWEGRWAWHDWPVAVAAGDGSSGPVAKATAGSGPVAVAAAGPPPKADAEAWARFRAGVAWAPAQPKPSAPGKGTRRTQRPYNKARRYERVSKMLLEKAVKEFEVSRPDGIFDIHAYAWTYLSWDGYMEAHRVRNATGEPLPRHVIMNVALSLVDWFLHRGRLSCDWRRLLRWRSIDLLDPVHGEEEEEEGEEGVKEEDEHWEETET